MAASVSNVVGPSVGPTSYTNLSHSTNSVPAASSSGPPAATLEADSVKLSLAANIKLMHHQGLSPSIIASRLGISLKQVDSYIPGTTQAVSDVSQSAGPSAAPSQAESGVIPSQTKTPR